MRSACKVLLFIIFSTTALLSAWGMPAENVLDLTDYDFAAEGLIDLDSPWGFYWNQFIDPKTEFSLEPDFYLPIPGVWEDQKPKENKRPVHGYGTFTLKILLPPGENEWGLKFREVFTACDIYINGSYSSSIGEPGITRAETRSEIDPHDTFFFQNGGTVELVIHLSNFHYQSGGLPRSITFGRAESIRKFSENRLKREIFLLGAFSIIFFYHLFLFLFRKKNQAPLYFALFCLMITLRTAVTGETIWADLFSDFPFEIMLLLVHGTVYLAFPFFFLFFRSLFPGEMHKNFTKAAVLLGGGCFLFALGAPARFHSYLMDPFLLLMALGMLYTAVAGGLAIYRKKQGAGFFFIGLILLILTFLNDMLFNLKIVNTAYISSYGLFFFILFQAVMLSSRFSLAFRKVESMSERLISLDKLKDEFLANTSHELRTPLNGIIGISDSILSEYGESLPPKLTRNIDMISSSGRRLSTLVNDILDFSRLKNRDLSLNLAGVDMNILTELVVTALEPLAAAKSLVIRNEIPLETMVLGDKNRLQQVLFNLLGNAIKFTDRGQITVSAMKREKKLYISVKDEGVGIPEEDKSRVFEAFTQIDSSISRNNEGTGIGLSITKKLINLHGGTIEVQSEEGRGTTFQFSLPAASEDDIKKNREEVHPSPMIVTGNSSQPEYNDYCEESGCGRILVLDDDPVNLQVLSNFLTLKKYEVEQTTDCRRVIKTIEESKDKYPPWELIITDLMMPGISGFEVTREIRKIFNKTELPILVLTAMNQAANINPALRMGANDFIQKPFEKEELYSRVENLITVYKLIEENRKAEKKLLNMEKALSSRLQIMVDERTKELTEMNKHLHTQAVTDRLTGIANRVRLDEELKREMNKSRRYGSAFSMILLDIDHFKTVNDVYGHQAGDEVLKQFASILTSNIRKSDLAGRWGGEEFMIICGETFGPDALTLAENLRRKIEASQNETGRKITASMGVSEYAKGESGQALIARVDKSLYQAKDAGRNRVVSS